MALIPLLPAELPAASGLQAPQQLFLAHVLHRNVGVVGIGRTGRADQRRFCFRLIDLDILLQRMDQVFLQVAWRDRRFSNLAKRNDRVLVVVAIDR